MKTLLPLLCFLACSWAEVDLPAEPNVVLQSVILGKKPDTEPEDTDECRGYSTTYNDLNMIMRKLIHGVYPQPSRYKREDSTYPAVDGFDDKTIERLLEALEELKQDTEKNTEDMKEKDEDPRKARLDQIYRRGGKWHKKIEECQNKRRKGDMESCKKMLKDNLEDILAENKDLEKKFRRLSYRKKDWKEELERRRLKEGLAESWPRLPEEDPYFPMNSHQRPYSSGSYLP